MKNHKLLISAIAVIIAAIMLCGCSKEETETPSTASRTQYVGDPQMTGSVTIGEATKFKPDEIYDVYNNIVVRVKYSADAAKINKDSPYIFAVVDLDGKYLLNKTITTASYFTSDGYIILDGKLYNSSMEPVLDDCIAISDNMAITRTKAGHHDDGGYDVFTYTFRNILTNEVYASCDGASLLNSDVFDKQLISYSGGLVKCDTGHFWCYCERQKNEVGYYNILVYNEQGNSVDVYEKFSEYFNDNILLIKGYEISNTGKLFVVLDRRDSVDETYSLDFISGEISELETRMTNVESVLGTDIIFYKSGSRYVISDKNGDVILDDLTSCANTLDKKYLLVSNANGDWGFFNVNTRGISYYDNATDFCSGYALVFNDGKCHFVNENLEPVSSDVETPAAGFFGSLVYFSGYDKVYKVNLT